LKQFLVPVVIAVAATGVVHAQQPKATTPPTAQKSQAAPAAAPVAPHADAVQPAAAPPGWLARCASPSRAAPLECAVEQNAILAKTGQTVVLVNVRVPGDTRTPIALIQLPLGINVQTGAKIQVDEGRSFDLPVQTCEQRGCFSTAPVAPDLLAAMKSGKQFKVSFQTMAKETVTIPMSLADFPAAYEKVK
jgi:invasion protein IalB